MCTDVDQQAHAQIAVVTVHTTGDDTIDDFAVRLEEKWKVGQKGTDRGLLFLIATDDHHYRFEVGYGLEGILPDGKVGSIGREMVPYLREGNYDAAITMATQDVANVIAQDAGVTLKTPAENLGPEPQPHPRSAVKDILLALFAIFVLDLAVAIRAEWLGGISAGHVPGWHGRRPRRWAVLAAEMAAAVVLADSVGVVLAAVVLPEAGNVVAHERDSS